MEQPGSRKFILVKTVEWALSEFLRKFNARFFMFEISCGLFKPGTDVMIFYIFSTKNLAKILAFFAQTTASFCKNCDHNIGF
jgi:hypothetical protein